LRPDGKVEGGRSPGSLRDASEREWLDAAARPKILDLAFSLLKSSGAANAVLEAAVLFEASWQGLCDFTVCVWAAPEIVRARLAGRGWSDSEIDARLAAQIAPDRKLELADFGVVNNASPELLRAQCAALSTLILNNSKI
jgi:dephospho-CoA kinase